MFRLKTERLTLMPLVPELLELWASDRPLLGEKLGIRFEDEDFDEDFIAIIKGQCEIAKADRDNYIWHTFWLMIRSADGICVGSADFKSKPDDNGVTEIGYGLNKEYEKRGYMTETVRAMCSWAFESGRAKRITAETETGNAASQAVLKRCGFTLYEKGETYWWKLEKTRGGRL